ncbi:unnamed protein product [Bursaphelenchus xylophilus]|uniref:(pine wood nematode) hypothetical protein n=1 Tax=Bursaphelenchus xylophilus TaxID=6326 RepID=A0A7I8WPB3_BURXY|nr:unnamed protein product [Bursaphelenchus xylophilus]CAG9094859.1 unnamed protein product [Bursaphelenchus xylophilus]
MDPRDYNTNRSKARCQLLKRCLFEGPARPHWPPPRRRGLEAGRVWKCAAARIGAPDGEEKPSSSADNCPILSAESANARRTFIRVTFGYNCSSNCSATVAHYNDICSGS